MPDVHPVEMVPLPLSRFAPLIGEERYATLEAVAAIAKQQLAGRTVWNVNSTASGGGVAEMLRVIVGYSLDVGIDVRWSVITADNEFFATSKRLHNQIHGADGGGAIGADAAEHYRRVTDELGTEMAEQVKPGDVVLLHDPQTAGMAHRLAAKGAHVVWRCHIGSDLRNEWTERGWRFLMPHLELCQKFVFSKRSYAPAFLAPDSVVVILPSIDPFSPKNEDLTREQVLAILQQAGILGGAGAASAAISASLPRPIVHMASIVGDGDLIDPEAPLVVQVSRWDRLKDMQGVMEGFVSGVPETLDAHLALVGPAVAGVTDDPEGAEVLAECTKMWDSLPPAQRHRVSLVTLPMDDLDENALMVNAVQRHATVVAQKSLAEGFGLTVAEAMWKGRAVIASAIGGITAQIVPGTGVLVEDPTDIDAFSAQLTSLLGDPIEVAELGIAARERVLAGFLGDTHLMAYAELMEDLALNGH